VHDLVRDEALSQDRATFGCLLVRHIQATRLNPEGRQPGGGGRGGNGGGGEGGGGGGGGGVVWSRCCVVFFVCLVWGLAWA